MRRASSERLWSAGLSGYWSRSVDTSVLWNSERDLTLTRVAERPRRVAVGRRDRHLDRVLDAVLPRRVLDERDRARDRRRAGPARARSVSARKKKTSESVEPSMNGNSSGSTASISSRCRRRNSAITPLCIHSQRRSGTGWQFDCCTASRSTRGRARTPGRVTARRARACCCRSTPAPCCGTGRGFPRAVPADAEAVAVRRARAEPRVLALHDERVLRLVEQFLEQDGRTGIREPTTHSCLPLLRSMFTSECGAAASFGRSAASAVASSA